MTTERNGVRSAEIIALEDRVLAHNYHPLPVVIESGEGAWVTDVDGRSYLDCLAAYSALNFGHGHPGLLQVAREQLDRLTLTSRAFHSDQLALFAQKLADLAGVDMVLPMNTGAEAVESAIKVARKWAYDVKGVPDGAARIIVAENNFHGRTSTIISFSTDPDARGGFGPYMPGFDIVPYGDLDALAAAIRPETAAVLIEPIQGEAGVLIPPEGYLAGVRSLCDREGVLFIADEVQSGLGRAGATFACDVEGVRPDVYVLGKALGGGIVPVSAVLASREVLGVLHPGQHGSTFGGNPLAAAVGGAVVDLLATGEYQEHARELSPVLEEGLRSLIGKGVVGVRVRGLWAGVDIDPALGTGRDVCAALAERGVLVKDTHGSTIRLAPPLVIERPDLDWAVSQLADALTALRMIT
ncbi:MAG TPA: ornithine--oxo-acid transaminase [Jiangellaceae bacterium]